VKVNLYTDGEMSCFCEDNSEGKKEASLHVEMLRRWAMEGMQ